MDVLQTIILPLQRPNISQDHHTAANNLDVHQVDPVTREDNVKHLEDAMVEDVIVDSM